MAYLRRRVDLAVDHDSIARRFARGKGRSVRSSRFRCNRTIPSHPPRTTPAPPRSPSMSRHDLDLVRYVGGQIGARYSAQLDWVLLVRVTEHDFARRSVVA